MPMHDGIPVSFAVPPLPDPRWRWIIRHVADAVHPLGMVLYGSRAGGMPRAGSDWDILAVVDDPDQVRDGSALCKSVRQVTGLLVDLTLGTPSGLALRLLLDPQIRFCLSAGIRIGVRNCSIKP